MYADLHIHSQASDGTYTPLEIIDTAASRGVEYLAITDHDIEKSYDVIKDRCASLGIKAIRGMEVTANNGPYNLHILAYNFKDTPRITAMTDKSREILLQMSVDVIKKMQPMYPQLSLEEYEDFPFDHSMGGWKGLQYLHKKCGTKNYCDGMKFYKEYGCDYTLQDFPTAKYAIDTIHDAGGKAVLAHPFQYYGRLSTEEMYKNFDELLDFGIDGIECFYPTHSDEFSKICKDYCLKHNLYITCGGDCHGSFNKTSKNVVFDIAAVKVPLSELNFKGITD